MYSSAILLAAGQSSRMKDGPSPLKGMLPWNGKTLIEAQLEALKKSDVSEIITVVGHKAEDYVHLANKHPAKIIYNTNFQEGKCSSIIAGLEAINKHSEFILIAAIDQPADSKVINSLIHSLYKSRCKIAIPVFNGKRGHPILFSAKILTDLFSINEDTKGLRNIIQKYHNDVLEVPSSNPLVRLNINTPRDYQEAVRIIQNVK